MLELTILMIAGLILAALFVSWALNLSAGRLEVPPAQVGELQGLVPLSGISYGQVEQLFDASDYRYLERLRLHDAAQQLERDRRQAALLWLRLLREDFDRLQQFRRLLTACGERTNPRMEWALLVNSTTSRLLNRILDVWIRLFGLYATPRVHLALVRPAREVSCQVACALARLSPNQLVEVKQKWAFPGSNA